MGISVQVSRERVSEVGRNLRIYLQHRLSIVIPSLPWDVQSPLRSQRGALAPHGSWANGGRRVGILAAAVLPALPAMGSLRGCST